MTEKTIRIWSGAQVLHVVSVAPGGTTSSFANTGGAGSSTRVDIEIDPFAGTIVDHSAGIPPQYFREDAPDPAGLRMGGARDALLTMWQVVDGWVEGAKSNHVALGHPSESEPCWDSFAVADIHQMIHDAARQVGVELPS